MPTLAEIMASPQALEEAADNFVAIHSSQTKSGDDMNSGIETDSQFIAIMDRCGTNADLDYKKFCEIGEND